MTIARHRGSSVQVASPAPRLGLSAALVLGAGLLAGCSSGTGAVSVVMTNAQRYEPSVVEVPVDGTVTWRNQGATAHTVTAVGRDREATGRFDSREVAGTGTYSHTFDEPGSYLYLCRIHGDREMVGVVEVVG